MKAPREVAPAELRTDAPESLTETPWHALTATKALSRLEASREGLTTQDSRHRLRRFGANRLPRPKQPSLLQLYLRQFKNPPGLPAAVRHPGFDRRR